MPSDSAAGPTLKLKLQFWSATQKPAQISALHQTVKAFATLELGNACAATAGPVLIATPWEMISKATTWTRTTRRMRTTATTKMTWWLHRWQNTWQTITVGTVSRIRAKIRQEA